MYANIYIYIYIYICTCIYVYIYICIVCLVCCLCNVRNERASRLKCECVCLGMKVWYECVYLPYVCRAGQARLGEGSGGEGSRYQHMSARTTFDHMT